MFQLEYSILKWSIVVKVQIKYVGTLNVRECSSAKVFDPIRFSNSFFIKKKQVWFFLRRPQTKSFHFLWKIHFPFQQYFSCNGLLKVRKQRNFFWKRLKLKSIFVFFFFQSRLLYFFLQDLNLKLFTCPGNSSILFFSVRWKRDGIEGPEHDFSVDNLCHSISQLFCSTSSLLPSSCQSTTF